MTENEAREFIRTLNQELPAVDTSPDWCVRVKQEPEHLAPSELERYALDPAMEASWAVQVAWYHVAPGGSLREPKEFGIQVAIIEAPVDTQTVYTTLSHGRAIYVEKANRVLKNKDRTFRSVTAAEAFTATDA